MIKMLIFAIILLVLYVGIVIWKKKELPKSISHMVYDLPKGGWRWVWTIWLWTVVICVTPSLIEALSGSVFQFVGFLAIASLLFVGAIPLFDADHIKWHNILAISGGILTQVCTIIICPWWMLVWLLFIALVVAVMVKGYSGILRYLEGKGVFISEILCSLSMIGSILTKII